MRSMSMVLLALAVVFGVHCAPEPRIFSAPDPQNIGRAGSSLSDGFDNIFYQARAALVGIYNTLGSIFSGNSGRSTGGLFGRSSNTSSGLFGGSSLFGGRSQTPEDGRSLLGGILGNRGSSGGSELFRSLLGSRSDPQSSSGSILGSLLGNRGASVDSGSLPVESDSTASILGGILGRQGSSAGPSSGSNLLSGLLSGRNAPSNAQSGSSASILGSLLGNQGSSADSSSGSNLISGLLSGRSLASNAQSDSATSILGGILGNQGSSAGPSSGSNLLSGLQNSASEGVANTLNSLLSAGTENQKPYFEDHSPKKVKRSPQGADPSSALSLPITLISSFLTPGGNNPLLGANNPLLALLSPAGGGSPTAVFTKPLEDGVDRAGMIVRAIAGDGTRLFSNIAKLPGAAVEQILGGAPQAAKKEVNDDDDNDFDADVKKTRT